VYKEYGGRQSGWQGTLLLVEADPLAGIFLKHCRLGGDNVTTFDMPFYLGDITDINAVRPKSSTHSTRIDKKAGDRPTGRQFAAKTE